MVDQTTGLEIVRNNTFDFMGTLMGKGVPFRRIEQLAVDESLQKRVAAAFNKNKDGGPICDGVVRTEVPDFFGSREWNEYFNLLLGRKELASATQFPWGLDVLNDSCPFSEDKNLKIKDTHSCFLGIETIDRKRKLSFVNFEEIFSGDGLYLNSRFSSDVFWFLSEMFATETNTLCNFRYYLKPHIPVFMGESFEESVRKLPDEYEVASVGESVMSRAIHHKLHGEFHNSLRGFCRESIERVGSQRVTVQGTDNFGICIDHDGDNVCLNNLGLEVSRKIPKD